MTLGPYLTHIRQRAGLSRRELCSRARDRGYCVTGIHVAALGFWEREARSPSPWQLAALLEACGATDEERTTAHTHLLPELAARLTANC